jgi:hypothetical protein
MDDRPLTPREKIEARREEQESRRSFLKHCGKFNLWKVWALIVAYLAWAEILSLAGYLVSLAQLLKSLTLIPKFCNGLIGVSLTDSVTALASN